MGNVWKSPPRIIQVLCNTVLLLELSLFQQGTEPNLTKKVQGGDKYIFVWVIYIFQMNNTGSINPTSSVTKTFNSDKVMGL